VVDELRLLRLLRAITDRIAVLRVEADADEARRSDPLWLPGIKYTFVTAIEACIDIAQHLCASEGWGPPETNSDAMSLLGRHGVLTEALADALRRAVGFRNVLVHDYVVVDDAVVTRQLQDLSDLEQFVGSITELLRSA
jgi:uncharacterized protein YutE (UPF0331/DUF86 family)